LTSHILVIPSWYSDGRGSGGGYFRDQALALKAAGHRVAILAPAIHTWRDRRAGRVPHAGLANLGFENDGVPVYRRNDFTGLPRLPYRNPLAWTRCGLRLFGRYIGENGWPDLVHAHCCLNAGVLALAINCRFGIPYIVTEHSAGPAGGRWWERDLIRRVAKHASRCIAVSPHLAGLLECHYPGSQWRYLPNVLGEAFLGEGFRGEGLHGAAPSATAADGDHPFVFLCVARMSPEKGHALLLQAFAGAFRGSQNVRLRLVGDGPLLAILGELSRQLGIAKQVDFIGALPANDVRAEMEAADAFALASNHETFGVVVIEALACGLPVVSTASGGPDHLIAPDNGMLVPCGDMPALRDALREMQGRASRYDRRAIRAEVIQRFGPDAFARQFAAIIA
jgi:glycosyltransferase involved in cell wall biosynthesis